VTRIEARINDMVTILAAVESCQVFIIAIRLGIITVIRMMRRTIVRRWHGGCIMQHSCLYQFECLKRRRCYVQM
jgi:hypothetical protein